MKNVIFDLGGVLIQWQPEKIVTAFTPDLALQDLLLKEVFHHQDWLDLDRGIINEADAAVKIANRAALDPQLIVDLFATTKQQFIQLDKTVALLKSMHQHGLKLYVLSNMSIESYDYLKKEHAFFDYFDGVVISGHEKIIKPVREIFSLICQRFQLQPNETLFLDDMKDNIHAAKSFGLNAMLYSQHPSCAVLIRKLVGLP